MNDKATWNEINHANMVAADKIKNWHVNTEPFIASKQANVLLHLTNLMSVVFEQTTLPLAEFQKYHNFLCCDKHWAEQHQMMCIMLMKVTNTKNLKTPTQVEGAIYTYP